MAKSRSVVWMEYLPVMILVFIIRRMPYRSVMAMGKAVALLFHHLLRNYQKIVEVNLDIAFKKKLSTDEKAAISRSAFANMVTTILELIRGPDLIRSRILSSTRCDTLHRIFRALKDNRGVIVCSAHLSNWYWPAIYVALNGVKVHAVVRPLDNPLLDRMMNRILNSMGIIPIPRARAAVSGLRVLKKNGILALMIDQNAAVGGVFASFFGIPASTMRGVSVLSQRMKCRVLAAFDIREGIYGHTVHFDPLHPPEKEKACLEAVNRYFEKVIRANPYLYFWLHPRWKKQPPGKPSLYPGIKT